MVNITMLMMDYNYDDSHIEFSPDLLPILMRPNKTVGPRLFAWAEEEILISFFKGDSHFIFQGGFSIHPSRRILIYLIV